MTNERIGRSLLPGFLMRLLRDARGNALAIIAAAVIPMAALSGSAIDMARLYVVKVRLQQACDAGVLAGRKFMDPNNTGPDLDDNATKMAKKFFQNNFTEGWFATSNVLFTPAKTSDSQVSGTAKAKTPLTVMGMFGFQPVTINVTCKARFDVADSDIMFVLDTTGSMGCVAADVKATCDSYATSKQQLNSDGTYSVVEKNNSRIDALRNAVLLFYDTVTTTADPTTHFRFGFVPYSATANVGGLLYKADPTYIADTNDYQSRFVWGWENDDPNKPSVTTPKMKQSDCLAKAGQTPWTKGKVYYQATKTTVSWGSPGSGVDPQGTCTITGQPIRAILHYQQITNVDTSKYKTGATVVNPSDPTGGQSLAWNGCVEERTTTANKLSFDPTNPPNDLAVDITPTQAKADPWAPVWEDMEFWRATATMEESRDSTRVYTNRSGTATGAWIINDIPCPKAAQRLGPMSRSDISNYLNASDFRPFGVTYHDVGMTWGTRLINPTANSLFATDTAAWPGRQAPNRYIIFLTDGVMEPSATAYAAHGMETFDKRVVGSGNINNLTDYHNARFSTACQIAKNHNIKVFVIAYSATASLDTNMTNCASPGAAYAAPTDAKLKQVFQTIAQQVAMLRIDQ